MERFWWRKIQQSSLFEKSKVKSFAPCQICVITNLHGNVVVPNGAIVKDDGTPLLSTACLHCDSVIMDRRQHGQTSWFSSHAIKHSLWKTWGQRAGELIASPSWKWSRQMAQAATSGSSWDGNAILTPFSSSDSTLLISGNDTWTESAKSWVEEDASTFARLASGVTKMEFVPTIFPLSIVNVSSLSVIFSTCCSLSEWEISLWYSWYTINCSKIDLRCSTVNWSLHGRIVTSDLAVVVGTKINPKASLACIRDDRPPMVLILRVWGTGPVIWL